MPNAHDVAAHEHYMSLIEAHYPPSLAALLAAAKYAHGLGVEALPLPALQTALTAAQEAHPEIRRDIGRTTAAIERRGRRAS